MRVAKTIHQEATEGEERCFLLFHKSSLICYLLHESFHHNFSTDGSWWTAVQARLYNNTLEKK